MSKNTKVSVGRKLIESIKDKVSSVFGTPKNGEEIKKTKTLVVGAVEQSYGIYQIPSFRDQVTTFWNDPLLKEAVTMFAEQVVATGFFLTSNPKYSKKISGKSALDVIKEWCDINNIDLKVLEIAIELKAFGNSFWRITDMGFVKTPVEAVWHAVRVDPEIPLQEQYHLQLVPIYGGRIIEWKQFIHFRIGTTGYHAPFGQGVLYSLLMKPVDSYGRIAPSIYDVRLGMRASLDEGFRKFSFGNVWIGVPNLSNEDFDEQKLEEKVAKMSSTGNRIITNSDIKVELEVPERTQSYDKFIKQMNDEFFMALADPSLKLGLEQGFTKATAVTASEVYKYKVSNMRKVMKEHFEDLFEQILDKLGYDGIEANVEMNFGPEEIAEYKTSDVFTAVDKNIINKDEARHILSKYHKWDITGKVLEDKDKNDTKDITDKTEVSQAPNKFTKKFMDANKKLKESNKNFNGIDIKVVKLNNSIAGISKDGKIVYIDEIVKDVDNKEAKEEEIYPYELLVAHKLYEYHLMKDNNLTYEEAHKKATQHEKDIAIYKSLNWEDLLKRCLFLLSKVKERNTQEEPEDLYKGEGK